jgi:micrococcal nuclease
MGKNKWLLSFCISAGLFANFQSTNTYAQLGSETYSNEREPAKNAKCHARDFSGIQQFNATLERVVDGDTAKIIFKGHRYSVRFLSIDTPETHFMGKSQGYWGDQATDQLMKYLPAGSEVQIHLDPHNSCDQYGRLLGYVYRNNMNTNEQMLRDCLAVMYCIAPSIDQCKAFGDITTSCIEEKKGIFSDALLEIPYEWRRSQSKRPHQKWVGNLDTYEVYSPEKVDQVPVGKRVFFMSTRDIKAPFHLVSE